MAKQAFKFLFSLASTVKLFLAMGLFMVVSITIVLPFLYLFNRYKFHSERQKRGGNKLTVGIFHPYANAGGGGEKVLWVGLKALQEKYPTAEFHIYTGDLEASSQDILRKVKTSLNVDIDNKNVKFVYLTRRQWVEPQIYPYFTLLCQCLGSIFLGFEAIGKFNPDIFIETTGFTFVLPIFKYLGGCKTGCYIHYPLINKNMLKRVQNRRQNYNNSGRIAKSPTLSYAKLVYYHTLSFLYCLAGECSDATLVNSTFTKEHLEGMWNIPLSLVYPPCEVEHLKKLERDSKRPDKIRILSLSQFRPEKDHPLQLQSLYELREILNDKAFENVTLVLCGSCRNQEDSDRVKDLQDFAKHLSLENHVEFKVNIPYKDLLEEFNKAYIVYPPCEVELLKKLERDSKRPDKIRILSLSQFRPEKDHTLQLQSLYELREILNDKAFENVTLVLCGSCRNQEDSDRVKDLQDFAKHLSLENHVEFMVNIPYKDLLEEFNKDYIVYPPCEVEHLKKLERDSKRPDKIRILSMSQFRPEKDHPLQLQSLYELREILNDKAFENVTLVLCGGCRNQEDSDRVKDLQDFAKHLSLENHVEFRVNIPYKDLLEEFNKAYIGIHTMLDEHFGISVVEQMAAGIIMVAHRSGGPLLDIIETSEGSRLGFLASTAEEFAYIFKYLIEASETELAEIRERARASCDRFSNKKFEDEFLRAIEPIFK